MKKKLLNSFLLTAALLFSAGAWAEDVTFDFTLNEWGYPLSTGSSLYPDTYNNGNISYPFIKDGVEIVFKRASKGTSKEPGSTAPKYFDYNSVKHIRFFSPNIMKVFAPAGKAITKIVFEMNSTTFNMTNQGKGTLEGDGVKKTGTWTGNATYVKIKAGATNQIKTMTITLADRTVDTEVPAVEAEETVLLDFNDPTIHTQFDVTETTYFSEDLEIFDGIRNSSDYLTTENLITTHVPWGKTTVKNGLYYGSGNVYLYLRNGTTTFKCDADKIFKNIKMTFYNSGTPWNAGNKINGETVTRAQLEGDGWTGNSNVVEIAVAGATRIGSITFTLADKPDLVLDETQSNVVTAGTYNVTFKRDFNANWNTVCLPFAINDIETVLGTGAKAYDFTSFTAGTLGFTAVSELVAGHPYIVYVPAAITDDMVLSNVEISAVNPVNTVQGDACFRGTYGPIAAGEWTKTADTDVVYGVTSEGKVQKAGAAAAMKGFRAYFDIPANVEARLSFFDETTGISEMKTMRNVENETFFDLQGRRVAQPTKGLYIVNGKKVVLK